MKEVITNAIIETLHLEIIITEGEVLEIWSIPVLDKNMITAEINEVTALRIDMVSVIFHKRFFTSDFWSVIFICVS